MDSTKAIEFDHVTFSYDGVPAVRDISFAVEQGDFMALIGPNGGGKTTLLKLALGLLRPQKGSVRLWGQEVSRFRDWHKIAYVPQKVSVSDSQFPATVAEVVGHGEYRGVSLKSFWRHGVSPGVRGALESLGLWQERDQRFNSLSLGQQQRVLLARAMVKRPPLLLLDEPTSSIDAAARARFYQLLEDFHERWHITVVLVSHDIGTVLKAVHKVACVDERLVFHGLPDQFPIESLPELYGLPVTSIEHHHPQTPDMG